MKKNVKNRTANNSKNTHSVGLIKKLDLQLFITITGIFFSGWIYINGVICNFTGSEPLNIQITYIVIHYIITLGLFLCILLAFLRGLYFVKISMKPGVEEKWSKILLENWIYLIFYILLCVCVTNLYPNISWYYIGFFALCGIGWVLFTAEFSKIDIFAVTIGIATFFPVFISLMTLITKNIEIKTDKEYYSIDDTVYLTVDAKGYNCSLSLTGVSKNCVYDMEKNDMRENTIIIPVSNIKSSKVEIGTISPVNRHNFFFHPFCVMLGVSSTNKLNKNNVFYTTKNISIKKYE